MQPTEFHIEAWHCSAPGTNTAEQWQLWLDDPQPLNEDTAPPALKEIPPLLRRRFNELGKYAAGASLALLRDSESVPAIFASRHGDTHLTLSLLEDIGRGEPLSPTSFSLAVHNAVCGLLSIARKDRGPVTAIAATEGLLVQSLFEALGQLRDSPRVLCVIYDVPLPTLYQPYSKSDAFPFALALMLSTDTGRKFQLAKVDDETQSSDPVNPEPLEILKLLAGDAQHVDITANGVWRLSGEPT